MIGSIALNLWIVKDVNASSNLSIVEMTLVAEAKNQGYEGMLAVAEVIRTRAKDRRLTYEQVILQPKQFSCWNDRAKGYDLVNNIKGYNSIAQREQIFNLAKQAWVNSASSNTTKKANLYHADYISPYWSKSAKVTYLMTINNHIFYRE